HWIASEDSGLTAGSGQPATFSTLLIDSAHLRRKPGCLDERTFCLIVPLSQECSFPDGWKPVGIVFSSMGYRLKVTRSLSQMSLLDGCGSSEGSADHTILGSVGRQPPNPEPRWLPWASFGCRAHGLPT